MTKKPSYEELKAQVARLTEESLADVDLLQERAERIADQEGTIGVLQNEVAWLKSRWPVPEHAVVSVTSTGNDEVPLEPISTTDTEASGSIFAWVFGIVLAILLGGLACWQAYTYYGPKVMPKPTADLTMPAVTGTVQPSIKDNPAPDGGVLIDSGTNGPPGPESELQLQITPRVSCWVQLTIDGKDLPGQKIEMGAMRYVAANDSIIIRDGCPNMIVFVRNSQYIHPVPEPGHKKDVEVVKFTKEKP